MNKGWWTKSFFIERGWKGNVLVEHEWFISAIEISDILKLDLCQF